MKKLLAVFAHPDDEGAVAGALAKYSAQGVSVSLICTTRGEVGQIADTELATRETLGEVREAELRASCDILGVSDLRFLDYRDSGMADAPENKDHRALVQADEREAVLRLVRHMREIKPDVVVTFEPYGWYGHPDHIATSKLVTAAYHEVGDQAAYPEAGQAWRPQRLYYAVLPLSMFQTMVEYAREHNLLGADERDGFEPHPLQQEAEAQITHVLDTREFSALKLEAMWSHRTQFGNDNWFRKIPEDILHEVWGREYFIQAQPTPHAGLLERHASELDY